MAKIRVWKLGSLEHRILPTETAVHRLATVLQEWDKESDIELIWGPDIDVQTFELNPDDLHLVVPDDLAVVQEGKILTIRNKA